ncbi:TPA: hypothetical protein ACIVM6_004055, partial [Salmonella enterica subsp. salamae serovar 21:z10:z6]
LIQINLELALKILVIGIQINFDIFTLCKYLPAPVALAIKAGYGNQCPAIARGVKIREHCGTD